MPPASRVPSRTQPPHEPEVVEPVWILKAAGAVVALGLFCAYLTLCIFFYLGQWQFVLHPSRTVSTDPSAEHLAFTAVRFADDVAGAPQLRGWWMPSDSPADPVVLILHSETGSMSDALPMTKALHDARLNVFVFDYRGYGQSAGRHPTEAMMQADAQSALDYVLGHHPSSGKPLVYGKDLAASLAVTLCARNSGLSGLILDSADGDTLSRVEADQRSRIVPINLLFHERFPLADPLRSLGLPKLLISYTRGLPPVEAQRAANPKMTVELPPGAAPAQVTAVVRRFLDSYVAHVPGVL